MSNDNDNPWLINWTLVHADADMGHILAPLRTFSLRSSGRVDDSEAYSLVGTPEGHCLANATLVETGTRDPDIYDIARKRSLQDTPSEYVALSDSIEKYMAEHPLVKRLEGIITVHCHAQDAAELNPKALPGHPPMKFETLIQFYRFGPVVETAEGPRSMLIVRTPLSPMCPRNGDGTAVTVGNR